MAVIVQGNRGLLRPVQEFPAESAASVRRVDPALGVMFFFAPNGVISNMCMSDPGDGHIRLRTCNGSNWQRWIATRVGSSSFFTWRNRATNRIVQSGAKGAQLTTVNQSAMISGNQQWKFSG